MAGSQVIIARGNEEAGVIDSSELEKAKASGYRVITVDEAETIKKTVAAESAGGMARGGVEAVVRGATVGASDPVLRALGADPKEMQRRKVALGDLGTVAEVAGAVAPALLSGGAGAAGTAARLAPAGVVARLGRGAAAVAERGLGSSLAGRVVGGAVGGAIEGGISAAGMQASEDALGDRDLSAERMIASGVSGLGVGALIGGGTVAAGAGIGAAVRGGQRVSRAAVEKVSGLAPDIPGSGLMGRVQHAQIAALGGSADDMAAASHLLGLQKSGPGRQMLTEATSKRAVPELVGSRMRGSVGKTSMDKAVRTWEGEFAKSAKAGRRGAQGAKKDLAGWLRAAERTPKRVGITDPLTHEAAKQARKILRTGSEDLVSSPASAHRWMSRVVDDMEGLVGNLRAKGATDADVLAKMVKPLRETVDDPLLWGPKAAGSSRLYAAQQAEAEALKSLTPRLRAAVTGEMDQVSAQQLAKRPDAVGKLLEARAQMADVLEKQGADVKGVRSAIEDVKSAISYGGDLDKVASAQARIKALEGGSRGQVARTGIEHLGSLIGGGVGGWTGAFAGRMAGEAAGVLARPSATLRGLGRVQTVLDAMKGREVGVGKAIERLMDGSKKVSKTAGAGAKTQAISAASREAELLETRARVVEMASDPRKVADGLDLADLHEVAPELAGAISGASSRAVQFLAARAPVIYEQAYGGGDPMVDPMELDRWERLVDAVGDPFGAAEEVASGTLALEHAETLREVYPKIYSELQKSTLDSLGRRATSGEPVSFDARVQLGVLLDMPLDESLKPGFLASLSVPEPEQPQQQAPSGGPGLDTSSHQTGMQRLESGGER